MDLQHITNQVQAIIREAGAIVRDYYRKPVTQHNKGTIDLVTDADRATEAFLADALEKAFPDIAIVGEEGTGYMPDGATHQWYVDPIDGTTNFAHKLPHFSVSIALATMDNTPLVGVIYQPITDECFYAYQGGGAFMNDTPLQVTATSTLDTALLATGFPYDRFTSEENNLKEFSAMMLQIQGGRRLGSAALDLAYVAAGRVDGYWEQKVNTWDVFAGIVLVQEAGGIVTNYDNTPVNLHTDGKLRIVASNPTLHPLIVNALGKIRA